MVFDAAMLMVDAVSPPWLEAHRLKVLFYHTEYGAKCWPAPLSTGVPMEKREAAMDADAGERQDRRSIAEPSAAAV